MQVLTGELLIVGKITAAYGIKGWVKVHSYTDESENLFSYKSLLISRAGKLEPIIFSHWRQHGKGMVALIRGCDSRNLAETYLKCTLHVAKDQLPHLPAGDYYWNQLIGLKVYTQVDGSEVELGEIASMMETGANDVVVISATASSVDNQERLIPYLVDQFVLKIDLEENRMDVDWDPEF
jgi:16S rRNA processing protein RimM